MGRPMKDMQVQLKKLEAKAANCAEVATLTTDKANRELFEKLAQHYNVLAAEVRKAMVDPNEESDP